MNVEHLAACRVVSRPDRVAARMEPNARVGTRRSVTAVIWADVGALVDQPTVDPPASTARVVDIVTFEDLYARESAAMVRVAYLLTSSQAQAEEIVQDAFAQVYERWQRIENPAGYLRTCVVNGARRQLRRRKLALERERFEAVGSDAAEPEYLADALASLPPKRRAAVVLRYFSDLSEADIAVALGVRPGTVKSMLHRSLADLRVALA